LAVGAAKATRHLLRDGFSEMVRIIDRPEAGGTSGRTEEVEMDTIDRICQQSAVERVSYLKIDTEGGDLDVLKGAEQMLSSQRVHLVEVEAGMNCRNRRHVPFEALKDHLERRNYFVFGIYEQMCEWPTMEAHLRRVNAVFVSEHMIQL